MADQIAEWKLEPELACPIPRKVVLKRSLAVEESVFLALLLLAAPLLFMILGTGPAGAEAYAVLVYSAVVIVPGLFVYSCECKRRFSKLLVSRGSVARGFIVPEWSRDKGWGDDSAIAYEKPSGLPVEEIFRSLPWWVLWPWEKFHSSPRVDFLGVTDDTPAEIYVCGKLPDRFAWVERDWDTNSTRKISDVIESKHRATLPVFATPTVLYLPEAPELARPYKNCAYRAAQPS